MSKVQIFSIAAVSALLITACSEPKIAKSDPTDDAAGAMAKKSKKPVVVKPIDEATTIDAGLVVGAQAPLGAEFQTKDGKKDLSQILENGPAVFIFTRSVKWCPYCQTQLKSINAVVDDFDARGYAVYGVSYDDTENQNRFIMNQDLGYEMLSDESSAVIDAFGLRDPQYVEGRAVGVPYASVLVVGKDGTVLAKNVSKNYRMRPTNEQILAMVDAI